MLLYTRLAPPKVPKKRSRTGCAYCKDKKKKCNEVRPQCSRCLEKGQDCIYEPVKPRQRKRRDDFLSGDSACSPTDTDGLPTTSASASTFSPASPSISATGSDASSQNRPSSLIADAGDLLVAAAAAIAKTPASRPGAPMPISPRAPPRSPGKWPSAPLHLRPVIADHSESQHLALPDGEVDTRQHEALHFADLPLISPSDNDMFNAMLLETGLAGGMLAGLGLDFDLPIAESADDGTLDSSSTGSSSSLDESWFGTGSFEQDIALLQNQQPTQSSNRGDREPVSTANNATALLQYNNIAANSALQPTTPTTNVPFPQLSFSFTIPNYFEFSDLRNRRALIDHFCNVLSHLLVFKEDSGNPFQKLVLPLCHSSLVVTNAVYALASAHLEHRGVEFSETSESFHRKVISGLAKEIAKGEKADRNELLAAIMLLIYYEVLVQKGRSSIVDDHLRGALTVMTTRHQTPVYPSATDQFLERAFRFYDVISALSLGRAPLSHTYHLPTASFPDPLPSTPENIDSLLGMFATLWPLIHRLSSLQALKRDVAAATAAGNSSSLPILRAQFETGAASVGLALEEWKPTLPPGITLASLSTDASSPPDSHPEEPHPSTTTPANSRILSILHNALAYRHSASIFLYRSLYQLPRSHPLVQRHTHSALMHCLRTVANAGPMSALLWPLFVAACEAVEEGDREAARGTFEAVERRQGMVNIGDAWMIVQEVWRRRDLEGEIIAEEKEDLWRRVSEDLGIKVVFG